MAKKKEIVKADGFALNEALKTASNFVKSTKDTLRAETKVLSYNDQIKRLQSGLGRQLDSIITAFNKYNNAVMKRINDTGLKIEQVVTPEIKKALIEPYDRYVKDKLGSSTIAEAIEKINNQRAKDLKNYGRNERNIAEINKFYDLKISKYVLPLQYIETQLNSLVYTKGDRKQIAEKSKPVLKIELATIIEESNKVVEEQKEKARLMAKMKKEEPELYAKIKASKDGDAVVGNAIEAVKERKKRTKEELEVA